METISFHILCFCNNNITHIVSYACLSTSLVFMLQTKKQLIFLSVYFYLYAFCLLTLLFHWCFHIFRSQNGCLHQIVERKGERNNICYVIVTKTYNMETNSFQSFLNISAKLLARNLKNIIIDKFTYRAVRKSIKLFS